MATREQKFNVWLAVVCPFGLGAQVTEEVKILLEEHVDDCVLADDESDDPWRALDRNLVRYVKSIIKEEEDVRWSRFIRAFAREVSVLEGKRDCINKTIELCGAV
jgi:hypothetical protein